MPRPFLPAAQRKAKSVGVKLTPAEWATLAAEAQARGVTPACAMREAALAWFRLTLGERQSLNPWARPDYLAHPETTP